MRSVTKLSGLACHFEDDTPSSPEGVMAVISHAYSSAEPIIRTGPELRISVPEARASGRVEVWRTGRRVTTGHRAGVVFSYDGRYLFCSGRVRHDTNYSAATENMYMRLLELVEHMGCQVARMWNIVGGITAAVPGRTGTDRYGEFCLARARAFRKYQLTSENMPAATGIGGQDGHTTVYLLGTRHREIVRIENPRQVPAYEYPGHYGPQAPSFARAAYVRTDGGSGDLFISGTASIVGHRTVHHGNAALQTRTTLENISELVSGRNLERHGIDAGIALRDLDCVKVYVKYPRDLAAVRRICESVVGPHTQVVYTVADVCREDLLVEIEGFVSVPDGNRGTTGGSHE